jgi:hypothetical protein
MVKSQNGKKVRHGGDSVILRPGGSGPMSFRSTVLYAGMGGWKGARRSSTGINDTKTMEPAPKKARLTKSWDNEPGTKRKRTKNRAWRGKSGRNMDNYKRDHDFSFSNDTEISTCMDQSYQFAATDTAATDTADTAATAATAAAATAAQTTIRVLNYPLSQGWFPVLPIIKDGWCDP